MRILSVYFGLAWIFSWMIWLPLYLPALGITGLPVLPYHHALGGFGPLLSALITTLIFNGRTVMVRFIRSGFQLKSNFFAGIALLSPFFLLCTAAIIAAFQTGTFVDMSQGGRSGEFPEMSALAFFLYNFIFFGIGEEAGWRGFALPHLQRRFNALNSSLLLTVFWAIWHWPLFLYRPGYMNMDIAAIGGWVFSLLTGSVLLTWLFNSSKGSIVVCALFHAAVDIAFTNTISSERIVNLTGILITLYGIAVVIAFGPGQLSFRKRVVSVAGPDAYQTAD